MLTEQEIAFLRAEVGSDPPDEQLQDRMDRLGSVLQVADEILRERLANLVAAPASLNVPGVIGVNTAANITALQKQLGRLTPEAPAAIEKQHRLTVTRLTPRRPR